MKPREEIEQLRKELHQANYAYYVLNDPALTDAEFDTALQRLRRLEADWPEYNDPNSPTQRVGGKPVKGFAKVKHRHRMLSLDNTFTVEETIKFLVAKGVSPDELVHVEPKVDGLSFSGLFESNRFTLGVTRGDGEVGDDVTQNARTISTLPLVIPLSQQYTFEVRGEIYMPRQSFEELNAKMVEDGDKPFANPRNAAAGTMKNRDSAIVANRKLGLLVYSLLAEESMIDLSGLGEEAARTFLKDCGFQVLEGHYCRLSEIAGPIMDLHERRNRLPYEIDGAVVKVLNPKRQQELGEGTKYVNWAVAHKYPAEKARTVMKSVTCQVGKTGVITPVAELEPVLLAGTTVSRASLMNADEVERIGCAIGDTVFVLKSGEIIPRVVGVADSADYRRYLVEHNDSPFAEHNVTPQDVVEFNRGLSRVWTMPKECPCCGTSLVKAKKSDGSDSVMTVCPNTAGCEEQVIQRLKHACCKSALDWDGMGIAQVRALFRSGVRKLSDLFHVEQDETRGTVLSPAAMAKFVRERERVKSAPLWRKLHALGIEGIGSGLSKDLEAAFPNIFAIADGLLEGVEKVVGEVNARAIASYIAENADEIELLDSLGFKLESQRVNGPLTGKTFVITGELATGTRAQICDMIEREGGTAKGSVTKKVNFLVIGNNAGNVKSNAAAKNGTTCITEEELYQMIGKPMPAAVKLGDEFE